MREMTASRLSKELGFHPSWLLRVVRENRPELEELGLIEEAWKGRRRRWYIKNVEEFIAWLKEKGYYLPED